MSRKQETESIDVVFTSLKKEDLTNRLRRCIGQLESVVKMIDADEDCEKVLIQLKAARRAADSAARVLLACHLETAIAEKDKFDYKFLTDLLDY